ncbi:MAG TPA: M28 family peptidase [Solimonas sp.]
MRPEAQGMPTTERIYGWIEDLVGIGYRRTGTPEGYAAAAYVKCQFESLGLADVQYETVTSWDWRTTRAALTVQQQPIDAYPVAHTFVTVDEPSVFSTGPGGMTAEIVDVGLGTPVEMNLRDVKGKIVLFDLKFLLPTAGFLPLTEFLWDPGVTVVDDTLLVGNPFITTYETAAKAAMAAGAVGFIGVLADYFDSNQYHNEFYRRTQVTIPGFWVTKREGARIRDLIRSGDSTKANFVFEGSRREAEARTVVGFLHGKSKDTIMVQSHHDSVFYGAVEDGSGTAAVLAQAQYYASQPPESREKTLMFITFDTHFTGYQSHREFVRKYITDKETPYNIVANVTLEHIGKQGVKGENDQLEVRDQPELRGIIETLSPLLKARIIGSVIQHDLRRTGVIGGHALCLAGALPTDASFVCTAGVPTASLIAGPNYLYDAADTLDKISQEDLVPVTQIFIELIDAIDQTPPALIGLPVPPLPDLVF